MNLRSRRDLLLRILRLRIRSTAYLRRWIVLGAVIGVVSGLGAALFFVALDFASQVFRGLAGYVPASPLGEGAKPITDAARPWMLPIIVGLGGLIASPAHRFRFALSLMNATPEGDAARSPRVVLKADLTVAAARARLESTGLSGAPVVDRGGSLRGSVDLVALVAADQAAKLGDLALGGTFVSADESLDDVLGVLADRHQSWVPVLANDRLAGVLSTRDVVAAYRGALVANVRQVNTVGSTGSLLEAEIGQGSVLAGKPVSETAWPRDSVLVSVMRGEKVIVPRGNVVLEAGDRLTVFTAPAAREALHTLLASRIATEAEAS